MGNKHQSNSYLDNFNPTQWTEVQLTKQQKQYSGDYKKYQHRKTRETIQKYQLTFNDEQDYKQYLESFFWRLHQDNIVNTKFLQQKHIEDFCSTSYIADVYLQSIPIRLSEVTDIPYPENLYVLYSVLDGYSKVYHFLGYLQPKENQICVDSQGFVKVWINSDLSKNYPQADDVIETKQQMTESMMVNQVIAIISENTDHQSQPITIEQYFALKNKRNPSFQQAKILIGQLSREYKTPIPECFQSILAMFNEDFNHQSFERKNKVNEIVANSQSHNFVQLKSSQIPGSKITMPGQLENLGNMFTQNQIPYPYKNTFGSMMSANQSNLDEQSLSRLYKNRHQNLKQSRQIGQHNLIANKPQSRMIQSKKIIGDSQNRRQVFHQQNKDERMLHSFFVPMVQVRQQEGRTLQRPFSNLVNSHIQINQRVIPYANRMNQIRTLSDRDHNPSTLNRSYVRQGSQRSERQRYNGYYINAAPINIQRPTTYQPQHAKYIQFGHNQQNSLNFLTKVNANRQLILNGNQKTGYPGFQVHSKPIVVPVPVARNNFVKVINKNYQISSEYPHPREIVNTINVQQGLVKQSKQNNNLSTAIKNNIYKLAKATQTRQQTPLNFSNLDSQVLVNQDQQFHKVQDIDVSKNKNMKIHDFNSIQDEQKVGQRSPKISMHFRSDDQYKRDMHYYTRNTQAQIDPQIARDLAIYSQMGQI